MFQIVLFLSALGCGLIGGVFFAFSAFVMKALARIPPAQGIAAMQSINIVVINPTFLTGFVGTAATCVAAAVFAVLRWSQPGTGWVLAGSGLYLIGTFFETIVRHLPLNDELARVDPDSPEGTALWRRYLVTWTNWNHVRTAAALAASAAFMIALR